MMNTREYIKANETVSVHNMVFLGMMVTARHSSSVIATIS